MPRWILIDYNTGFIWGDSADFNGRIFTGSAVDYAKALDVSLGNVGRTYDESGWQRKVQGYDVYRADVKGSDAVATVTDGQDSDQIAAVVRDCTYCGFISFEDPQED